MGVVPAPAVYRVGRLLDAMAKQSRSTLAELSRTTGISKATAHSLLLALAELGYVRRTEHPVAYSLGPALIRLGQQASRGADVADLAADVLTRLSRETDCTAMVGVLHGTTISVLAAQSPPHPFGVGVQSGTQLAFAAPVGAIYAAYAPAPLASKWLDLAEPPLSVRRRKALDAELELIRERGWSATVRARTKSGSVVRELTKDELEEEALDVLGVSAPILGDDRYIDLSVAVVDVPSPTSGNRVVQLAAAVCGAAEQMRTMLA
jgi:DNA-binding IclR family transcriptional regulator